MTENTAVLQNELKRVKKEIINIRGVVNDNHKEVMGTINEFIASSDSKFVSRDEVKLMRENTENKIKWMGYMIK